MNLYFTSDFFEVKDSGQYRLKISVKGNSITFILF